MNNISLCRNFFCLFFWPLFLSYHEGLFTGIDFQQFILSSWLLYLVITTKQKLFRLLVIPFCSDEKTDFNALAILLWHNHISQLTDYNERRLHHWNLPVIYYNVLEHTSSPLELLFEKSLEICSKSTGEHMRKCNFNKTALLFYWNQVFFPVDLLHTYVTFFFENSENCFWEYLLPRSHNIRSVKNLAYFTTHVPDTSDTTVILVQHEKKEFLQYGHV